MNNFRDRDSRGGGSRGGFSGGDRGNRPMFKATCSSCHKSCEVPFRPTGDKPVYCRDCFAGRSAMGGDRSSRPDPRSGGANRGDGGSVGSGGMGGNDELKKQLEAVNAKLERLISSVQTLATALTPAPKTEKKSPKKVSKKK